MLKRVVCFSLVLVLLPAAFPHALADGFSVSFSFCTVENGGTARQGDTVRFEISAPGAVLTQMMIVPPDSSRNGMDGPVCEVELNAPGTWAFVAYAQDSAGNTVHSGQWRILVEGSALPASALLPENDIPLPPQMVYMNRFYKEDYSWYSGEGDALLKWLSMDECSGQDRINSGFLMLEEEYLTHYNFSDLTAMWNDYWVIYGDILGTVTSLGFDKLVDLWANYQYKSRFPNTWERGYQYYTALQSIFLQYINDMYCLADDVDQYITNLNDLVDYGGTVGLGYLQRDDIEYSPYFYQFTPKDKSIALLINNTPKDSADVTVLCVNSVTPTVLKQNSVSEFGKYHVTDLDTGENLDLDLQDLLGRGKGGKSIALVSGSDVDMPEVIRQIHVEQNYSPAVHGDIRIDGNIIVDGSAEAAADITNLKYETLQDMWGTADQTHRKVKEKLKSAGTKTTAEKLESIIDAAGLVLDVAHVGLSAYAYIKSEEPATAYQEAYYQMVKSTGESYINLVNTALAKLDNMNDFTDKDAVKEALSVLLEDITITNDTLIEEKKSLNISNARRESLAEFLKASIDLAWDALKLSDSVKNVLVSIYANHASAKAAGKLGAEAANKAGAAAANTASSWISAFGVAMAIDGFIAMIVNGLTDDYASFVEQVKRLYALKKVFSLSAETYAELYRLNPTLTNAVSCIECLQLNKALKITGEKLLNQFYLSDQLHSKYWWDMDPQILAVILNEILDPDSFEPRLPQASFTEVWAVENRISVDYTTNNELLGYYRLDHDAEYDGKKLNPLPSAFKASAADVEDITQYDKYDSVSNSWPTEGNIPFLLYDETFYASAVDFTVNMISGKSPEELMSLLTTEEPFFLVPHFTIRCKVVKGKVMLYSRDGVSIALTKDEHKKYIKVEEQLREHLEALVQGEPLSYNEVAQKIGEAALIPKLNVSAHTLDDQWLRAGETMKYINSLLMYEDWLMKAN